MVWEWHTWLLVVLEPECDVRVIHVIAYELDSESAGRSHSAGLRLRDTQILPVAAWLTQTVEAQLRLLASGVVTMTAHCIKFIQSVMSGEDWGNRQVRLVDVERSGGIRYQLDSD